MEYDDELNDNEERDYRKSLQENQIQQKKELPKRSTRGLRMNALVGKAIEEDDQFYNGLFGEGGNESDQDFNSQNESCESAKDSFDSDFGMSGDEDNNNKDGEEGDENFEGEDNLNREEKREKKKIKFTTKHKI